MVVTPGLPGDFPKADWNYSSDDFLVRQREDYWIVAHIHAQVFHLLKFICLKHLGSLV